VIVIAGAQEDLVNIPPDRAQWRAGQFREL